MRDFQDQVSRDMAWLITRFVMAAGSRLSIVRYRIVARPSDRPAPAVRCRWRGRAFAAALALAGLTAAQAQLIDDVEVRTVGARAEASLKLAAQVRLVRSVLAPNGRTLQVYFQIIQSDEATLKIVEESRRSPPNAPIEPFTATYSPLNQTGLRRLDVEFSQPVKPSVRLGANGRSLVLTLPLLRSPADRAAAPPAPSEPVAPPTAVTATASGVAARVEDVAALPVTAVSSAETRSTLQRGKQALAAKDFETALAQFNIVLNLPQNDATIEAQELIGSAREGLGQTRAARAEYELYLKLYPEGAGAERVKARLAALLAAAAASTTAPTGTASRPTSTTVWGSVSQSYYGGQSRIDTSTIIVTPATNATIIDQQTITGADQSSLVTNVDVNARIRSGDWETRMTLRDTYNLSLLNTVASRNRLTAAYADVRNQADRYGFRLGRQSPNGLGVLYRFDGVSASYNVSPSVKAGFVAGTPSDITPGERKTFYGGSVDVDSVLPNLGVAVYAIEQRAGGYTDRRAVGTEARYNSERINGVGTFDYDTALRRVNIGSFQATYNLPEIVSVNALYDFRTSPPLQLANGLQALAVPSLAELVGQAGLISARSYASALTPTSRVASLGITVPFARSWQAGLDYRVSSVSATGDTPMMPATPASGQVKTITAQLIGTGFWRASDVLVLNASYLSAATYSGLLVAANPRFVVANQLTLEPVLRWYRQTNAGGATLVRWSPSFRGSYRWSDKIFIDAEASWELSRSTSATINQNSHHLFYYIGYRYDF